MVLTLHETLHHNKKKWQENEGATNENIMEGWLERIQSKSSLLTTYLMTFRS